MTRELFWNMKKIQNFELELIDFYFHIVKLIVRVASEFTYDRQLKGG